MSVWDNQEFLKIQEERRAAKRFNSGRLTFDCFHLKYRGDRAHCSLAKRLGTSRDGSLSLANVLRGITSGTCRGCKNFITEE